MSAATIASSSTVSLSDNGLSYAQNVGRAARALLSALFATRPHAPVERTESREASLNHLYSLASSYDSVMPNLAQELRAIASRN